MSSQPPAVNIQPVCQCCCYQLDPTQDPRWAKLVEKHAKASVFHTVAWLQTLQRTYGYEPVAFTTSPPTGELKNAVVFCRIKSWLTGRRLVSLPFSDHCEPLCDSIEDLNFLLRYLQAALKQQEWKYLELRPINGNLSQAGDEIGWRPAATYFLHTLDLRPDLNDVFLSLDKDSVRRRIQRAERAGLVEKCGRSEDLLKEFYTLFVVTRGRHHVPPIPFAWFRNLVDGLNTALEIRLAYKDGTPIAAILTLQFRDVIYYKYGCSEARSNNYGGIPWLLWKAIAAGKSHGAIEFDLGRTQQDNPGLLAFKNHWVRQARQLVYWTFPNTFSLDSPYGWKMKMAKRLFSFMPSRLRPMTGSLIYRHIG